MKMGLIVVTVTANASSVAIVRLKEKKKYLLPYALPFLSWLLTSVYTTGSILGSNPNAFVAVLLQG
jgi:hypothetical protein